MKALYIIVVAWAISFGPFQAQSRIITNPSPARLEAPMSVLPDTLKPPPDFVAVEKQPSLVSKKEPEYPKAAIEGDLEGVVVTKMWIDENGHVRQVVVLKSDNEVFNQSAIDAGKQWVFTPAIKDDNPVAVWVVVPFKFKIKRESKETERSIEEIRRKVHTPTVFIVNGPASLGKFIQYPKQAASKKIQGTVIASVGLSDSLTVTDIRITKGLDKNCDRAVLVGLSSFDFSGAKGIDSLRENGKLPIIVQFILPQEN